MANPRHQERSFESSAAQVEYKVGEEATRATRDIADFNKRAARTNVDMLRSGMETARHLGVERRTNVLAGEAEHRSIWACARLSGRGNGCDARASIP